MTRRPPRRTVAGALALASVLATAACGTTDPRAAVLLGEQSVPVELVTEQVTARLAAAGPEAAADTRAELQRQVLTQLVRGRLLDRIAEEEGVTVREADVDAALQLLAGGVPTLEDAYRVAEEQAGLDRETARRLGRDQALRTALLPVLVPASDVDEEELRAAYEQAIGEFDTVSARVFPVADPAAGDEAVAQVNADPARFDEVAAELASDPTAVSPEPVQVGRGTTPPEVDGPLFATPVGQAALVTTEGGTLVVLITDRTTVTFEEAREQLRERVLAPQADQALASRLAAEAEELGVRVNPRFGEWDAQALEVVADDPATSRPVGDSAVGVDPLLPGAPPSP